MLVYKQNKIYYIINYQQPQASSLAASIICSLVSNLLHKFNNKNRHRIKHRMYELRQNQIKWPISPQINISFEIPSLCRMLKVRINPRITTLKSLRPLLAQKFNTDFGHIRLKFNAKNEKKQLLDQQMPICYLPYFQNMIQIYKVEVDIEYEGG